MLNTRTTYTSNYKIETTSNIFLLKFKIGNIQAPDQILKRYIMVSCCESVNHLVEFIEYLTD